MCMRGREEHNPPQRLTSRGSGCQRGRGLVLLQQRNMTWGWAKERGREWDSLIGINGSSEVWTGNLRMGSNDWKQNGKRQTCFHFSHTHRDRPIHGSLDRGNNRLPLQTGAPAFMRVRASMHSTSGSVWIPFLKNYFRSKANASRPQISSTVWDETLAVSLKSYML